MLRWSHVLLQPVSGCDFNPHQLTWGCRWVDFSSQFSCVSSLLHLTCMWKAVLLEEKRESASTQTKYNLVHPVFRLNIKVSQLLASASFFLPLHPVFFLFLLFFTSSVVRRRRKGLFLTFFFFFSFPFSFFPQFNMCLLGASSAMLCLLLSTLSVCLLLLGSFNVTAITTATTSPTKLQ